MTENSPIAKRVKRHVVGPAHHFFAATAPHHETLALKELESLALPLKSVEAVPGGVAFEGRLQACYAANLHLRIPNRILMRLSDFKVTNFRRLEKKLSDIPWELWIHPSLKRTFAVQTSRSRLYHKTAIQECTAACISLRMDRTMQEPFAPVPQDRVQRVYIRGIEDRFTVSLDSSGDILYKRGLKQHAGRAPLRETLAAAILMRAGYTGREPLVDPMCGSGTFSLEAAMIAGCIPPGWFRDFIFMTWPAFRKTQWAHLRKHSAPPASQIQHPAVFASDRDPAMCHRLEEIVSRFGLSKTVRVSNHDFFAWTPTAVTGRPGLVVLNPPYGLRMDTPSTSVDYFKEIFRKLQTDYRGWRLALLLPQHVSRKGLGGGFHIHPLQHGGLNLSLVIGHVHG